MLDWIYTCLLYIYMCSKQNTYIACGTRIIYIYIYTQPATLASKYILRIKCKYIYILYNYKCKILAYRTSNADFQIYSIRNILNNLWKGLSRKHVPSTSFPALAEFSPTPDQIVSLYIVTRNKDFRNNDLLYILQHFLCFGSAALACCLLTSCIFARLSFRSCDRIFYID